MNYDALILDADDTLFDFVQAESYALTRTFDSFGESIPLDQYLETFQRINHRVWRDFEEGRATIEEIRVRRFVELLEALGLSLDPGEVSDRYIVHLGESDHMVPGAHEFLEYLEGRLPMVILTNGLSAVQRSRFAKADVLRYFTDIVISQEVGIQKPDPEVFRIAAERLGVPDGSRILMIGDSLTSDIDGALAFGIDACWFNFRGKPSNPAIQPTFTVTTLPEIYPILGLEP